MTIGFLSGLFIGAVAGVLVVFGVWFCDNVVHVDDPVGAVAVHCLNGIWGTIAVGLFATTNAPESTLKGLFYGGGFGLLGTQLLGVVTVRFEADTIRTILQLKVDQSDLSPADKQKLQSVLQELPAENIKHLSTKIVDMGWDSLGSLMSLIQSSVF